MSKETQLLKKANELVQTDNLLKVNPAQDEIAILDTTTGIITINKSFIEVLDTLPELNQKAKTLLKTDINNIDESEMTELNKKIKGIKKTQDNLLKVRKVFKQELDSRVSTILNRYDELLAQAGFDDLPQNITKLNQLHKDFQENRANKRWMQVKEFFDAQLELYPEFTKYAPNTLGSFNHYRIHHPNLVSKAKTKKVNDATQQQLNDDLYQYHEDLNRLLESTLSPVYYQRIIDQYVDEPTTSNMLNLIDRGLQRQIKDEQQKLINQVEPTAVKLIDKLWFENATINEKLDETNIKNDPNFEMIKLKMMRAESDATIATLTPQSFLSNNQIDEAQLELTLKDQIKHAFGRVYNKLKALNAETTKEPVKKEEIKKPEVKEEPYTWLIQYLQANNMQHIHNNNKLKAKALRNMFNELQIKNSIWRQHIKNADDIMETVKYITNL